MGKPALVPPRRILGVELLPGLFNFEMLPEIYLPSHHYQNAVAEETQESKTHSNACTRTGSVLAGEARKVKISILREGSKTKTIPVEAQLLLIRTLAATVLWGGKAFLEEPLLGVSIIMGRASGRQTAAVACWMVRQMHGMATTANFMVQGNAEGSVRRIEREMVCNATCKEQVS
jgi:hypothetical protein